MIHRTRPVIALGLAIGLGIACSPKEDSDKTSPESNPSPSNGGGTDTPPNKVSSVTSLGELKLSGALTLTLPEAFGGSGGGSALHLLAGKKSQEACMMGSVIKEEMRAVQEVAGFFCHLEAEKDRVKFGKKYRLMTPFGEFAKIFVDNSKISEGKLTIGFCSRHEEEGAPSTTRQLITIESLTDQGPKGSILTDGAGTWEGHAQTYARSTRFDMTVAGVASLVAKMKHTSDVSTFVRSVQLDLRESAISKLTLSNKGSHEGNEFIDRGVALVGSENGSAVFQYKGEFQENTFQFARRAYFSNSGEVLAAGAVSADVIPAIADVPAYLPPDFKPDTMTGWVGDNCPDFDEEVNLDPASEVHTSCDQDHGSEISCWDQDDYESSTEEVTVE